MIRELVEVISTERLSPSFQRLELGGPALARLGVDGPWLDQRFKLIVPDGDRPVAPLPQENDWYAAWAAKPASERGHMRTYSVRDVLGTGEETRLVVDVVLHSGAHGPGSGWAETAKPGDLVGLVAPERGETFGGIEFAPGDDAELLLVGDESAVPAVARILGDLPADAVGAAFLEVPEAGDILPLEAPEGVSVSWYPRTGAPRGEDLHRAVLAFLGARSGADDVAEDDIDPDLWETPTYSSAGESVEGVATRARQRYAWIAGEAKVVTGLRRILVRDLGWERGQVCFMGYWREGRAGG